MLEKIGFRWEVGERKGIDKLLESWDAIHDKNNWELEIIGEGSLKYLVDKYKQNVHHTSFLQPEDLVKKLKESHALILPSFLNHGGLFYRKLLLVVCQLQFVTC